MKLPLMVAASAKTSKGGARVRLHNGTWKLALDGLIDSKLAVQCGPIVVPCEEGKCIDGPVTADVFFITRGTEQAISVYAELQK